MKCIKKMNIHIFRYQPIFTNLVEKVTQKINTFSSINDEIYDDDVSICIYIIINLRKNSL